MSRLRPLLPALLLGCAGAPRVESAGPTVDLVIAATTDVHGRLRGWDYYANAPDSARSLAAAATVVDSIRAANPGRVILLDAGDLLQGNPLAYVAARITSDTLSPIVAAMNAMRYDAAAIGNHEFNYGVPLLERAVAQATFPFLSANTRRLDGGRAFRGWTIVERGGVRVGLVGATTPGVMVWDRDHVHGRVEVRDIIPGVRSAVAEARRAGAEVVVATVHSGLTGESSYDTVETGLPSENVSARLAREVPGIDLIVYGHSHREMADTVIGSTMLVQPKNWAASVAVARLSLERRDGRWTVVGRRGVLIPSAGHAESPAVLAATQRAHDETVRYATTPIGSTPVAWRGDSARVADTPLLDLILEVERKAAGAELASTAAFSLDARLGPGPVTVADLARLYPYDNTLRAVRISGRQLRDYLEYAARYYRAPGMPGFDSSVVDPSIPGYNFDVVAGADYTLDISRPFGARVTRLSVGGRAVADADSFTLALNNYRQTGGGGYAMLRGAPVTHDQQLEIRQLLIDEVRRRQTIGQADYFTRNWTLVPDSLAARGYRDMHRSAFERLASPAAAGRARADPAMRLRLLATNDFHGALEPRPDAQGVVRGGAAYLATAIALARAGCEPPACETLLLDGGDMFQGTPASNLAFGRPVVELYERLGYAAAALGNHEWDWGRDTLRARMRQADYRILGANVRDSAGRDVPWVPNDTLVRRGRLTIGIIGVATVETPNVTRASNVVGLRFVDPAPVVDSTARALRARGADAVVVVAHAGAFCDRSGQRDCSGEIVELARRVTERVDAIVAGHTHSLIDAVINGIPIVQARSRGTALGRIDLAFDRADAGASGGGWTVREAASPVVTDVRADSLSPDAAIDSVVQRALARVAPLVRREVATLGAAMPRDEPQQYALGNFIADAQRWAGKSDIAVMNNGGIRAGLRAGRATYGDFFEVQPFANTLYKITATGRQLRAYLERLVARRPDVHVSGVTLTYDSTAAAGSRLVSATLDGGRPIRDDAAYTIVMNDFMATGGEGLVLARTARARPLNIVDLDALIDYARSRPQPVAPPAGLRIRAVTR